MNEEYLNLLNNIRDTLEDIKGLQEELHGLLDPPSIWPRWRRSGTPWRRSRACGRTDP